MICFQKWLETADKLSGTDEFSAIIWFLFFYWPSAFFSSYLNLKLSVFSCSLPSQSPALFTSSQTSTQRMKSSATYSSTMSSSSSLYTSNRPVYDLPPRPPVTRDLSKERTSNDYTASPRVPRERTSSDFMPSQRNRTPVPRDYSRERGASVRDYSQSRSQDTQSGNLSKERKYWDFLLKVLHIQILDSELVWSGILFLVCCIKIVLL